MSKDEIVVDGVTYIRKEQVKGEPKASIWDIREETRTFVTSVETDHDKIIEFIKSNDSFATMTGRVLQEREGRLWVCLHTDLDSFEYDEEVLR